MDIVQGDELFAGVDLGGTTVSVGFLTAKGLLRGFASEALGDHCPEQVVRQIAGLFKAVLQSEGRSAEEVLGLGVCTPGLLDVNAGLVSAANLRGWNQVPLVQLLAEELGWDRSRVTLEHDTNAALLAEAWTGAAAGCEHVVLLTLGTGVGGAILCDGRLLRGSRGQAGEIGHSIVVPDGRSFGRAGVDGIMEGYASASAVAIQARDPPADSSLSKLKASKGKVDCEDVFKHADAGDHFARKVVQETAKYLAVGCINCCRFVDPELILFSGGMAEAGESLLQEVRRHLEKYHWNLEPVRVKLQLASSGRNSGMIGAARAAMLSK